MIAAFQIAYPTTLKILVHICLAKHAYLEKLADLLKWKLMVQFWVHYCSHIFDNSQNHISLPHCTCNMQTAVFRRQTTTRLKMSFLICLKGVAIQVKQ